MWRASAAGKGAAPSASSAGSKMRFVPTSAPSSPFKSKGPAAPTPGRGDSKVYPADNYKYPFEKDISGECCMWSCLMTKKFINSDD